MSLIIITLLVYGLYNMYVYILWLSEYTTMMEFYILYFICLLTLYLFVMYKIHPHTENGPIILGFSL